MRGIEARTWWLRLALLALLSTACARQAASSPPWTVLFYFVGDGDLESEYAWELGALASADTTNARVVALLDRSPERLPAADFTDTPIDCIDDWSTAKVLELRAGHWREIAEKGEVDAAGRDVLKEFLAESLPARGGKCALVLKSHGLGWRNFGTDEDPGGQFEVAGFARELEEAFGRTPIDLLVLDVCYMAHLEVLHSIAPYAGYVVASEEGISTRSFPYASLVTRLSREPTSTGRCFGEWLVRSYRDPDAPVCDRDRDDPGVALFDSAKVAEVVAKTSALGTQLIAAWALPAAQREIESARQHSLSVGKFCRPCGSKTCCATYDLGAFVDQISDWPDGIDDTTRQVAKETATAITSCVKAMSSAPAWAEARGISIHFPCEAGADGDGRPDLPPYASLPIVTLSTGARWGWVDWLVEFVKAGCAGDTPPAPAAPTWTGKLPASLVVASKVPPSEAARLRLLGTSFRVALPLPGGQMSLGSLPFLRKADDVAAEVLRGAWDGNWFLLSSAGESIPFPVERTTFGPSGLPTAVEADGVWLRAGGGRYAATPVSVRVAVTPPDPDQAAGRPPDLRWATRFLDVLPISPPDMRPSVPRRPAPGDQLTFRYGATPDAPVRSLSVGEGGLRASYGPVAEAPDTAWSVAVELENAFGQRSKSPAVGIERR